MRSELDNRRLLLQEMIRKCGKEMEGYDRSLRGKHLQVHCRNGTMSYYARMDGERCGKYLSKKVSMSLIQKLAQKDYDQKVVKAAMKELEILDACLSGYPEEVAEEVHVNYPKELQELITPLAISDEQYAKEWQNAFFDRNERYQENCIYATKRGEMVRSKSEVLIADALYYEKIPYYYERSLYVENLGTCYPDFTVLNTRTRQEYIWEHFGMMSDPEYAQGAVRKIQQYQGTGYMLGKSFISTFEDAIHPLTPDMIKEILEGYLL